MITCTDCKTVAEYLYKTDCLLKWQNNHFTKLWCDFPFPFQSF